MDFTAAEALRSTYSLLKDRQTRLVFAGVPEEVKAKLDRYGITDLVGNENFFVTVQELVGAYEQKADAENV